MEFFKPVPHKEIAEIKALAEKGITLKVGECFLNGDFAKIPADEAQRILSLSFERAIEYEQDMILPVTDEGYIMQQNRISMQENRLIQINFRIRGLKQVIESLYNDK